MTVSLLLFSSGYSAHVSYFSEKKLKRKEQREISKACEGIFDTGR